MFLRLALRYVVVLLIASSLSGCFIPFYMPKPELENLPEASGETTKVIIAVEKSHESPKLYIYWDFNPIAKLKSGSFTEVYVKPEQHSLDVAWYYMETDFVSGGGGFAIVLDERRHTGGTWLFLKGKKEQKILLKFNGKNSHDYSLKIDCVDEWPAHFSLDEYSYIPPGPSE